MKMYRRFFGLLRSTRSFKKRFSRKRKRHLYAVRVASRPMRNVTGRGAQHARSRMDVDAVLRYRNRGSPSKAVGVSEQYDRLIGGGRLIHQQGGWCARAIRPRYRGGPPYPPLRRLVCQSNTTALQGDAAFSPSKAVGVPEPNDRLIGGSHLILSGL